MADAVERQRQLTRQRLEARRRKREEQQYEEDMAASIVTMAEKQFALIREKTMLKRAGAKDTVKLKLILVQQRFAVQLDGVVEALSKTNTSLNWRVYTSSSVVSEVPLLYSESLQPTRQWLFFVESLRWHAY